ncbi:hypothetical protein NMG60_11023395 [Bertholletia excelsa]
MAALSIVNDVCSRNSSIQELKGKNCSRRDLIHISCQSRLPIDRPSPQMMAGKENENYKALVPMFLVSVRKLGKRVKESLSPKQKGDWKDLVLMSLSFAVYVYISQKIVCAYCAWMSIPKQPW